jgi:hypothetical protein
VTDGWPDPLHGVTESLVTTLGPNDRWNVAPLGLHAGDPVTARTWGRTRTWRNFTERGGGVVQFTTDPVLFAEAALSVLERDEAVLEDAAAWVRIDAERLAEGSEGDTTWVDWALHPVDGTTRRRTVPTFSRGYAAVVEATIAVSRLDVPGYDRETLLDRLRWLEDVVDRAGGPADRTAIERVRELADTEW